MQNFDTPQDTNPAQSPDPASNMRLEQPADVYSNTLNSSDLLRNEYLSQKVASLLPDRNVQNLAFRPDMQATFSPQGQFNPFDFTPGQNLRPMYPQHRPEIRPQLAYQFNVNPQYIQPHFRPPQYDQTTRPAYGHYFNNPMFNQRYTQQKEYDFTPPNEAPDRPPAQRTNSPERLITMRLDNRIGPIRTPDAMVYLPPGFNPAQRYDVVLFNHGLSSTAESSVRKFNLIEQMKKGHPQTVLIVPEWQLQPGSRNHLQGRFSQEGFFTNMLKEIIQKTPELAQGGMNAMERMHIFSHSAGYTPTGTILNKNPEVAAKVYSVTMLDSLYSDTVMPWIQANQQALANGEKQFRNIYGSETQANSQQQQARLKQMMMRLGRPDAVTAMPNAYNFRDTRSSIIFTRTNTDHGLIPNRFISNSMDHSDEA